MSTPDPPTSREAAVRLPLWLKAGGLVMPLLLVLGLIEVTLRLLGFGPQRTTDWPERHWVADARLGFVYGPNLTMTNSGFVGAPVVRTDEWGWRMTPGSTAPDAPAVVCVGDSTVFCAEVKDTATWPAVMSAALAPGFPCKVVNAGVRGYNSLQSRRMLERVLQRQSGVRFAIYMFCDNDFVENLNPIVYHPVQAPTLWRNSTNVPFEVVEVTDPLVPWGQKYYDSAAAARSRSAPRRAFTWARRHCALLHLIANRLKRVTGSTAPTRSRPQGSVGPVVMGTPSWAAQEAWARANGGADAVLSELRQMKQLCAASGASLIVTRFTCDGRDQPVVDLAALCREAAVDYVDLAPAFTEAPDHYRARSVEGTIDPHYNEAGARAAGVAMAARVLARAGQGLPPRGAQ